MALDSHCSIDWHSSMIHICNISYYYYYDYY